MQSWRTVHKAITGALGLSFLQARKHLHLPASTHLGHHWVEVGFFAISFLNVNIYPDRAVSVLIRSRPNPSVPLGSWTPASRCYSRRTHTCSISKSWTVFSLRRP